MQTCKPFVGTLCSLTRPFVAVFVLQLIALRWGMGIPLTPALYLQSLAIALGVVGVIGALLYRVNCRAYDAAKLQHTQLLRLQQAIESAPAAVFLTDPEQRIVYVNPAFTELTGYTPDEAIGQRPSILKSGLMPEAFYAEMFAALQRGERFRGRVLNRKKGVAMKTADNGVEFSPQTHYWAETVIAPIHDDSGALLGYLSIQTDITEQVLREQAEARRQELHALLTQLALTLQLDAPLGERLPQLLDALTQRGTVGDGSTLAFWERDGETLRLHTAAGALRDYFQRSWETLIVYEWDYDAPRAIQLSLQGRTVNAVVVPVRWMNQSLGMLLLVCDRCRLDRVGLDPVLREFLTDLGELVAMALMRERSRQALLNAKAEAERLAQARTEFLANMSHEIRTPMNGVLGMLNLLKDTPLTDEQRDLLQTAETSAQHLLEILNDILNLAKIEAGQMKLERTPTDLKRLVRETCEMVRPQARLKGILLREELPDGELYALADPTRLRQILLNLLSNAIKFTERGEVVARLIQREASADNAHALRFEVQDTGIGIPPREAAADFRAVPSGGRLHHAQVRRHRAGAGDQQEARGANGRADGRRQPSRRRLDLLVRGQPARLRRARACAPGAAVARRRADAAHGAARAGRRRQLRQPEGHPSHAGEVGHRSADCQQRTRGAGVALARAVPSGADGLPDARNGRLRGDAPNPRLRATARTAHAHHRAHCQRAVGRPRKVPRMRDGRLPHQACQSRPAVGEAHPVGDAAA
jgi:PAS domain S-box-containing protein